MFEWLGTLALNDGDGSVDDGRILWRRLDTLVGDVIDEAAFWLKFVEELDEKKSP